jgi:2-iminoacetate synthase
MNFIENVKSISPTEWTMLKGKISSELLSIPDIAGLLLPNAGSHLEELAQAAHNLTVRRFGKTIKLYAPVYISNECINGCLYCGFNSKNQIARKTLSTAEALKEAEIVMGSGHRHLLFVSGEHPTAVPVDAICEIARSIRSKAASIAVEVQPLDENGYKKLAMAGIDGVTLYQETYDETAYTQMHPYGPKSIFKSRLAAIAAAGKAGMRFLGIGALLGLSDWRRETLSLVAHARYLMKTYWQASLTVSVPRLRDSASGFKMPSPVNDRDLAHMICVLRLALPDAGIILSTREPAILRDRLLPLGITQMSAGSVTNPGGYSQPASSGNQFELEDTRSPAEIADMLKKSGYDAVWKDWDNAITPKETR